MPVAGQLTEEAGDNPGLSALAHGRPLVELGRKVSPAHTALVVIDVQNDFCAEGGMMDAEGLDLSGVQAMVPRLARLIDIARAAGVLCVFVRNVYSTKANWYLSNPWLEQAQRRREGSYIDRAVCEADGWNGEFFGPIRPGPDDPVITKHRFCALTNTDLDLVLRTHQIQTVVLTGVATNVCVETTARSAFVRDYYVVISSDCVATYSAEEQELSLRVLDRYFGQVVTTDQLSTAWAQ
jgi:ureidoacrylate peracid hydrolase